MERWQPIAGYEDTYEVSSLGQVRRKRPPRQGQALNPRIGGRESHHYAVVWLGKDGKGKGFALKRIVWSTFRGEVRPGQRIINVDGDPLNCSLDNLECVARQNRPLSDDEAWAIMNSPESSRALAKHYGCSIATTSFLKRAMRLARKHLKGA